MWEFGGISPAALLDDVPTGIVVIDRDAVIQAINGPAADMVKASRDELVGRPLYEMVHPDDLDFAVDLVGEGSGFGPAVMGPIRIRYLAVDGTTGDIEIWSRQLVDVGGWVLVLTHQSTSSRLNDVTASVAAGEEIETTMSVAVEACRASPISAAAAIVLCAPTGLRPATAWPFEPFVAADVAALITESVESMQAVSRDVMAHDDAISLAARQTECKALWTYPIVEQNGVVAVLVLLRDTSGAPTANQDRHIDRLVSVAELAFSQATHRRSLETAATTDALTGLRNRLSLDDMAASGEEFGAVLYVDLDGFKSVNDEFGHTAGDYVLRGAAERIAASLRSGDVCVRIGGDEFVVVVTERGGVGIEAIARRLVHVLAQPFSVSEKDERTVTISASIGVSHGADAQDLMDAIAIADEALLRAKADGKNRWVVQS